MEQVIAGRQIVETQFADIVELFRICAGGAFERVCGEFINWFAVAENLRLNSNMRLAGLLMGCRVVDGCAILNRDCLSVSYDIRRYRSYAGFGG